MICTSSYIAYIIEFAAHPHVKLTATSALPASSNRSASMHTQYRLLQHAHVCVCVCVLAGLVIVVWAERNIVTICGRNKCCLVHLIIA